MAKQKRAPYFDRTTVQRKSTQNEDWISYDTAFVHKELSGCFRDFASQSEKLITSESCHTLSLLEMSGMADVVNWIFLVSKNMLLKVHLGEPVMIFGDYGCPIYIIECFCAGKR